MCSRTAFLALATALGISLLAGGAAAQSIDSGADFASWLRGPASLLLLPDERELLHAVDDAERAREFVAWFWQRRDPDPSTAVNEWQREFRDRLSYVEREFAERGTPGWRTARGHLYLVLGPPTNIGETSRPYRVGTARKTLAAWIYRGKHAADPPLVYLFATTSEGVKLVAEGATGRLRPEQESRIEDARRQLVRDRTLPRFAVIADRTGEPLALQGRAGLDEGGVLAEFRLRIQDLFGEPHGDALRYRLQIELGTVASAGSAATAGSADSLGEVSFDFPAAEVAAWADQPLRLAVWISAALQPGDRLQISEPLSGRSASVRIAGSSDLPAEFAIARQLAVVEFADGAGVAVAYFPTCARRHPVAVAHLLAGQLQLLDSAAEALAGGRMALLPVDTAQR